jgi:hypothetical protein
MGAMTRLQKMLFHSSAQFGNGNSGIHSLDAAVP